MDIIEFLEENDIPYWTEGKNVSKGWTAIQCPYCDDHSNHMGITPDLLKFSCWKCGESGKLAKLIRELVDVDWSTANDIARDLGRDAIVPGNLSSLGTSSTQGTVHLGSILPHSSSKFPRIHREYLKSRRFKLKHLKQRYNIKAVHTVGKYRFRIIVPYYLNGYLVNWVARDVTNKADKKYLACPNEKALQPIRSILYNIDRARNKVVIVEGVTDVWRIGNGAVAASGQTLTNDQLALLIERRIKKAYVVFDEDAVDKADRYANKLSAIAEVEIIELEKGDPAEQNARTISKIRGLLK